MSKTSNFVPDPPALVISGHGTAPGIVAFARVRESASVVVEPDLKKFTRCGPAQNLRAIRIRLQHHANQDRLLSSSAIGPETKM